MGGFVAALKALAALLGMGQKRQELVNSPEMQANAKAKVDQSLKDQASAAIATGNIDEVRKQLSE